MCGWFLRGKDCFEGSFGGGKDGGDGFEREWGIEMVGVINRLWGGFHLRGRTHI